MSGTEARGLPPEASEETARYLRWVADLQQGPQPCFHCGCEITAIEKPGRSLYGRPCGCRLYQGPAPKWARPKKARAGNA